MKNLSHNLLTFLLILFITNGVFSQSTASMDIDMKSDPLGFAMHTEKVKKPIKIKKDKEADAVYFDISDIDMSTTIDVKTNTLEFDGGENYKYSKIQLTNKETNKTMISRSIDSDYKIDVNLLDPGAYILILSNEKGDIKSEEIIII